MVLALVQNHTMTKKEQNAKVALEMRQHITSWQNSKMSPRDYCSDNGLAVHKLYYWLNKSATCKADVVIVSISLIKGNRETYHSVGSSLPRHARRVIFGCEAREIIYRIAARLSGKAARRELTWKFHPG